MRAVFGGGQILVPAGWRVVTSVRGLGGISDSRPPQGRAEDAPELTIEGMVVAGGFAVMSEIDDDEAEWLAGMDDTAAEPSVVTNGSSADAATTETEMTPAG